MEFFFIYGIVRSRIEATEFVLFCFHLRMILVGKSQRNIPFGLFMN
jgi:hypothetical protein